MNTKKQGSVFMELSSSIDFYMPCSLVILTYVKAGKLHTPLNPPPLTPFTKTLQVSSKATSQCCKKRNIPVAGRCRILSLIVRRVQPTRCNVSQFIYFCNTLYSSVSQPPGRGPVPGPGINYTWPREVLLEFVFLVF